MIEFIAPYTFTQFGTTGSYSAIADLHTSQFTVTHALGFSVFTSRILTTDLSQSHCHFKLHMEPSCHSLIPFLPLFCNCQLRRLDKVPLDYCSILRCTLLTVPSYTSSARTPRKTPSSTVKNACLQLRCLAIDVLLLSLC
jgi:hypothetical protein